MQQHHNSGDVSIFFTQRLISKLTVQYMKNLVNLSGGLTFTLTLKLIEKKKKKKLKKKFLIVLKIIKKNHMVMLKTKRERNIER